MTSLNILHYALSFFPVSGGMTTRIYNLIQKDGNHHFLVAPRSPSDYIPENVAVSNVHDQYDNIAVTRCKLDPVHRGNIPILDYHRVRKIRKNNAQTLIQHSPNINIDLIYGHGPIDFGLAAFWYAQKHRRPLIFEVHSIIQDNLWQGQGILARYHDLMNRWAIQVERNILNRSEALIVQTEKISQRIQKLYRIPPEKIHILYNGVDTNRFNPALHAAESRALRDRLPLGERIMVLYAGLLDEINGIRFFLEVYPQIPRDLQKRLLFYFAGRGECATDIEKLSHETDNVIYAGLIDYKIMPSLMGAADVFVIPRPSTLPAETLMPVKLLEVMAMEKDVLVSSVGGMTEVVQNGFNGFTFHPDDAASFITGLRRIAENLSAGKSVGKVARETVKSQFSWQKSRQTLADIYQSVRSDGNCSAGRI